MTHDEIAKTAIWAVDMGDKYNMQITKVIEIFKAMNKFHTDIETIKSMMEEGFSSAKGAAVNE